jgi:drug/metabolite transporter (DMT)-like permease
MSAPRPPESLFARAPAPLRGTIWMLIGAAAFAAMTALVRVVGHDMHPYEITFFRNFFGLMFMAPWLWQHGFSGLRTRRIGMFTLRGLTGLTAMLLWFQAITLMPLGAAIALSFTAPLFGSLAAVTVLGERMGLRRTLALITGFIGALIILRPGMIAISVPAVMVLVSSVFIASSQTIVKLLARTESPSAIVTWMGLYLTPMSLVPALFYWRTPGLWETAMLVTIGGLATIGQVALTRAYAATEVTIVLPFDYARLPFAAAIGYFAFAEQPDGWTWIGAAIIAAATVYIAHREARLARRTRRDAEAAERIGTTALGAAIIGGAELSTLTPAGPDNETGKEIPTTTPPATGKQE